MLTVIVPPTITNLPQSLTVTQGLNATFTVGASGTAPFTYQWTFNSGNISGATASSYTAPMSSRPMPAPMRSSFPMPPAAPPVRRRPS